MFPQLILALDGGTIRVEDLDYKDAYNAEVSFICCKGKRAIRLRRAQPVRGLLTVNLVIDIPTECVSLVGKFGTEKLQIKRIKHEINQN